MGSAHFHFTNKMSQEFHAAGLSRVHMSALGLAIPINPTVKNTTINKQLTQQYDMYVYIYNTYISM